MGFEAMLSVPDPYNLRKTIQTQTAEILKASEEKLQPQIKALEEIAIAAQTLAQHAVEEAETSAKAARQSEAAAKKSHRIAVVSLVIAAISTAASILFGILQIL